MSLVREKFTVRGTNCESCASIIKKQAKKVEGVEEVEFDYATETGHILFDKDKTSLKKIFDKIEEKGYACFEGAQKPNNLRKILGWAFGIIGIVIAVYFIFNFVEGINLPEISQNMGYGLLFVVGLLTGFHCISMCGGFVVSYTAKDAKEGKKSYGSHLKYGIGKLVSYTLIGALFGLVGSIIAFTPLMRGIAGLVAGLFLVLFGFKMLNVFPVLRKIQFKTPKFITKFVGKNSRKSSSPLVIGLLNGLMIACGPLQAIYIMAAGTGSVLEGAKLLFVFGLGTLPVMLGFGFFASLVSNKLSNKILKFSGVVVIILGLMMINTGLTLTGAGYDARSVATVVSANNIDEVITGNAIVMDGDYQVIEMTVDRYGWNPDKFVLQKNVPVKWIITGEEINGCNNAIQVPKLGLNFGITQGEQIIEFTPTEEGVITWSCWMGMIPGTFVVVDNVENVDTQDVLDEVQVPAADSCGGSCGSSSCGAATGSCGCGRR